MRLIDADKIIQISIHVPAWGTTDGTYAVLTDQGISIHVPAWGTTYHHHGITHNRQFQSTFPRGERRRTVWHQQSIICQFQSTFPRGERHIVLVPRVSEADFNPRSRVGNDGCRQSTQHICFQHFNPRSRVGNDGWDFHSGI